MAKKCSKCGEVKEISQFRKHRASCISCEKEYRKQYRQRNEEHIKQYQKQYHVQYKQDNKERIKEIEKKYYQENKERKKQYQSQYYHENIEYIKQHKKKYRKQYNQSEQGREVNYRANLKRRSYKHKVIYTPIQRKRLLDRDNWSCQSCGCKVHDRNTGDWNTPDKAHINHIVPISKGGNSKPENLRILCRSCNLSKRNNVDKQLELIF